MFHPFADGHLRRLALHRWRDTGDADAEETQFTPAVLSLNLPPMGDLVDEQNPSYPGQPGQPGRYPLCQDRQWFPADFPDLVTEQAWLCGAGCLRAAFGALMFGWLTNDPEANQWIAVIIRDPAHLADHLKAFIADTFDPDWGALGWAISDMLQPMAPELPEEPEEPWA